jgi:predicted acylesterase/phospholipase RssA
MIKMDDGMHALILSGGGAYGAYEVGVMKALFSGESAATRYTPINASIFTGTSVGALNAAFMTAQPGEASSSTARDLENIWLNEMSDSPQTCGNGIYRLRGDPFTYFDPGCIALNPAAPVATVADDAAFFAQYLFSRGANFIRSSAGLPQRALQLLDMSAFISIEPLRKNTRKIIHFEGIRRSDRILRVAATNWNTGELKVFENMDMTDEVGPKILQGASAIPGIFPPVEIAGDTYVDGGLVMNTPLKLAIKAGATTLHVIYLDPEVRNIPLRRLQNTFDTAIKMFSIMFATIANEDIDHAREINQGLSLIGRVARSETLSNQELQSLTRFAGWIDLQVRQDLPQKKLTIHRHRPRTELGGALGMLNFNQEVISGFIERGFNDAVQHDCASNNCVLPN